MNLSKRNIPNKHRTSDPNCFNNTDIQTFVSGVYTFGLDDIEGHYIDWYINCPDMCDDNILNEICDANTVLFDNWLTNKEKLFTFKDIYSLASKYIKQPKHKHIILQNVNIIKNDNKKLYYVCKSLDDIKDGIIPTPDEFNILRNYYATKIDDIYVLAQKYNLSSYHIIEVDYSEYKLPFNILQDKESMANIVYTYVHFPKKMLNIINI